MIVCSQKHVEVMISFNDILFITFRTLTKCDSDEWGTSAWKTLLWIVRFTQLFKRRQAVPPQQSQVIIFLSTTLTHTHHKVGQELPESYCLARSITPSPSSCGFKSSKISPTDRNSEVSDEDKGWAQSRKLAKGYGRLHGRDLETQSANKACRVKAAREH